MADTIFALSSGAGKAGIAVFRLSGPSAFAIAERLCGALPAPRCARLATLQSEAGAIIDYGLVIPFKGPTSFTGEDVVELHLHGSRAVRDALFEALAQQGARPAEAGEFTLRALYAGKLDLAQAEGLADLIDAETSRQREQALGQLDGALSKRAGRWRRRLLAIESALMAAIDFPDEDDAPKDAERLAHPEIDALISELNEALDEARGAKTLRDGFQIALVGPPNAGKSSLLNTLAGTDAAIVSDRPGTTRDVIEARLDIAGAPVSLLDMAGLREASDDAIEREGMARARARAASASMRLGVFDPRSRVSRETCELLREGDLIVWTKSDLGVAPPLQSQFPEVSVSAHFSEGVGGLLELIADRVSRETSSSDAPLSRERHLAAARDAIAALTGARDRVGPAPDLASEDIRVASRRLGAITGAVDVEDVLSEIFSRFCIGK